MNDSDWNFNFDSQFENQDNLGKLKIDLNPRERNRIGREDLGDDEKVLK